MGNESKGKKEESAQWPLCGQQCHWQGHHTLGLPQKGKLLQPAKSPAGGLQFLVRRNKLRISVFMYIRIFPFSHWKLSKNKTSWFRKEMKCSIWVPLVRATIAGTVNVCRS